MWEHNSCACKRPTCIGSLGARNHNIFYCILCYVKTIAGTLSVATGDAALLTVRNEHRRKAAEYNIKHELTKTKQRGS
jgi:hypothetical protein